MNKVIEELNEKLRALAGKKTLSPDDLQFLEQCLYNKWYGVQVNASKVLARYPSPKVSALLKEWFLLHLGDFTMTHTAYRALRPCLKESDIPWVLDLYFQYPTSYKVLYLYREDYWIYSLLMDLLSRFINEEAIEMLILACENDDNHRHVRILAHVDTSRRKGILKALLDNPNVPNKADIKETFRVASF
jgi:hypothetical protein